jgi:phage shock protein E
MRDQPPAAPPAGQVVVKNIGPQEAAQLIEDEAVVVLDVRTPQEYEAGRIAGAVNIDYRADDFRDRLAELDRDEPYLIHCASGRRSAATREVMQELGFTTIYHLDGGIQAWQQAGKPVDK